MRPIRAFFPLLAVLALITLTPVSLAQVVVVRITTVPPPLPVYVQPVIPGPDYIWAPGFWAWGPDGYYWVPGTWVLAPAPGLLWTPGYWAWRDGIYVWRAGYWGPRVGFYGGINYGYGYTGVGYQGGYWNSGVFVYNRSVTNVGSVNITNVYNKTVINNTTVTNVSFNGGTGGVKAQPTQAEQAAAADKHIPPTAIQTQHQHGASTNRALLASVNQGKPAIAATTKAGHFSGPGVIATKGAKLQGQPLSSTTPLSNTVGPKGPQPGQINAAGVPKQAGPKRPPQQPGAMTLAGRPKQEQHHGKKPPPHDKKGDQK